MQGFGFMAFGQGLPVQSVEKQDGKKTFLRKSLEKYGKPAGEVPAVQPELSTLPTLNTPKHPKHTLGTAPKCPKPPSPRSLEGPSPSRGGVKLQGGLCVLARGVADFGLGSGGRSG